MSKIYPHGFHIPVMGLCYTIDTPLKVARFGISSVISVMEDNLVEEMREYHCSQSGEQYIPIAKKDIDHRAKRITAYLDLMQTVINRQIQAIRSLPFEKGNDLTKYFELLPDNNEAKLMYLQMCGMQDGEQKISLQNQLREKIVSGSIDINIMTKTDKDNFADDGTPLPLGFSDAMAALRGFANSKLSSGLVFSAGMNPRLYSYVESFNDFFPDQNGYLKKRIILKVSDYRSALIQGKFLAKKGIFISEFRIESGLNCGGHAFPTDGLLLGPIMEEFKNRKEELNSELLNMCNSALQAKGKFLLKSDAKCSITVQGGVGTANEHEFLLRYYKVDSVGWGSPFLLVPEATNVDDLTLQRLITAKKEDYYTSYASPLGIAFNNFKKSTSQDEIKLRIEKNRPGSPCVKEYLITNTEFTLKPICTASRQYQELKINQLKERSLPETQFKEEFDKITEKECLCEGLGTAVLIKDNIIDPKRSKAVAICPGPNLAYFSKISSLSEMVNHIYGHISLLNPLKRSNMFINELSMYVDHLKNEIRKSKNDFSAKQAKSMTTFKDNLSEGIEYYRSLIPNLLNQTGGYREQMMAELEAIYKQLSDVIIPQPSAAV